MPKIPTFESQGRPTAEVGGVKTSFQVPVTTDFINKAQSTVADYYIREQEAEAKLKSLDYENKAYVGLFDLHDKWKNHPIPSEAADGFQKQAKEYITKYVEDNLSNENNFVKKATQSKLNGTLSTLNLSVLSKSRDQFEKDQQRVDNEFGNVMGTRLSIDNTYRNFVDSDIDNYLNTRFTDPDPIANVNRKRIELQKLLTIKDDTLAYNDARTKPEKFLGDVSQDPTLYRHADQNKIKQYIVHAQNHMASNAGKLLREEEKAVFNGSTTGIDYNLIRQGFVGSPEYNKIDDTLKTLEVVKPVANQIINSNFGEGYKNIELLNLNTTDPILKKKAMAYLKNMNDQKINTIVKDGGAEYFINNDKSVNDSYDNFLIQQDPISFKTYTSLLNKKYDEQQIPPSYRTYLSKNQITEIKKTFDGFENGQQKSNYIETIKQTYGESYPQIFNQLNKTVGIGFALSGSVNDPELKSALATSNIKPDQFKLYKEQAKLRANDLEFDKNLNTKIYNYLKPYREVLERQPYSDNKSVTETLGQITDSLANSAYVLSNDKTKSADELATLVTSKFLTDYDFSNKNYYIPSDINGVKVNKKLIDAKATLFINDIKFGRIDLNNYNIVPFEDNGVPKPQETFSLIKKYGEFYLDGSNGLVFGVKLPNGKFKTVDTIDPQTKKTSPIKIGFLDYDGTFQLKDNNNNNYKLNMDQMLSFMDVKDMYTPRGMPALPF